jgi:PPOX class F420-dependent enzyme/OxyR family protein
MTETNAPSLLSPAHIEYLSGQRLGRLATAGADHKPHVAPTSFRYNPELGTVDAGGLRVAQTKKYRDVQANGWAAIVIDDLVSITPWRPVSWRSAAALRPLRPAARPWGPVSAMRSSGSIPRRSTASESSSRPRPPVPPTTMRR